MICPCCSRYPARRSYWESAAPRPIDWWPPASFRSGGSAAGLCGDRWPSGADGLVKGSVRRRGSKWDYRFRGPEKDPSTGDYSLDRQGRLRHRARSMASLPGSDARSRSRPSRQAVDTHGRPFLRRVVRRRRTVDRCHNMAELERLRAAYVIPWIGERTPPATRRAPAAEALPEACWPTDGSSATKRPDVRLLVRSRREGPKPTARDVSEACKTTIHAARAAVRRYKSGIMPKADDTGPGTEDRAQRTRVDPPGTRRRRRLEVHQRESGKQRQATTSCSRRRREVWTPEQIQTFLTSVQNDRFAPLFLLELTTGIREARFAGSSGRPSTSTPARSPCMTIA